MRSVHWEGYQEYIYYYHNTMINIWVATLTGKVVPLEIDELATVEFLKERIQDKEGKIFCVGSLDYYCVQKTIL